MEFDPVLVHEWLRRTTARLPEKTAIVCGDQRWTYRMVDTASSQLALHWLSSGMRRGDRVAIFLENTIEAVVCMYAAMKAGGAFIVLEPGMKAPKLANILGEVEPCTLVSHAGKNDMVHEVLPKLTRRPSLLWVGMSEGSAVHGTASSESWEDVFDACPGADLGVRMSSFPRCVDVDLACLVYTSGSTGQPKGVMCSHHNMVSACRSVIQYLGNTEDDVILSVLPLSFSYGLYQVLMCFVFGGTVILEPGFVYPHASLKRISLEKVTGFPIVPSILSTILRLGDASAYGISRLRYMTNAGAALPEPLVRRFRSLFPNVAFYSMYGLTECKRVSYLPPEDLDRLCSSVGRAMPNCEVRLVDEEGREVQPGAVGELIVRGSNIMQGYWHDPEGSRDTFGPGAYHSDRWLRTGDMFTSDAEGNLYHAGRRDDMIKCRGERVSPREVEAALLQIGGILEAAVRGVPDEADGQAIAAFVVKSPGSGLTLPEIRRECSRYLESTRVPRHIKLLDRLPRNDRGKIDWKELHPWDAQEKST